MRGWKTGGARWRERETLFARIVEGAEGARPPILIRSSGIGSDRFMTILRKAASSTDAYWHKLHITSLRSWITIQVRDVGSYACACHLGLRKEAARLCDRIYVGKLLVNAAISAGNSIRHSERNWYGFLMQLIWADRRAAIHKIRQIRLQG